MDQEVEQLTKGPITRRRSGVVGTPDRVLRTRNEKAEGSTPSTKKEITPDKKETPKRTLRKSLHTDTPKRNTRASSAQPISPEVKRVSSRRSSSLQPESPKKVNSVKRSTRNSVTPTSMATNIKSTPKHRCSLSSSVKKDNSPESSKIPVKDPVKEIKRITRSASSPAKSTVASRKSSHLKDPLCSPSNSSPESEVKNLSASKVTRSHFAKILNLSPVQEIKSDIDVITSKDDMSGRSDNCNQKSNLPEDNLDLNEATQNVEVLSTVSVESEMLCISTAASSNQDKNESCAESEDSGIKEMEDFNPQENNVLSSAPESSSLVDLEIDEGQNRDLNCQSVKSSEMAPSEDQILNKSPVVLLSRCIGADYKQIKSSVEKIPSKEKIFPNEVNKNSDLTESVVNPSLYQCSSSGELEEAICKGKNESKNNFNSSICYEEQEPHEIKLSLSVPVIQLTTATPDIVSSNMSVESNSVINVKTEESACNKKDVEITCEILNDVSSNSKLSETPVSQSLCISSGLVNSDSKGESFTSISETECVENVDGAGLEAKIGKVAFGSTSKNNVEESDGEHCLELRLDESDEEDKKNVQEDPQNNTSVIKGTEENNTIDELPETNISIPLNSSTASTDNKQKEEINVINPSDVINKNSDIDYNAKVAIASCPNRSDILNASDRSLNTDEIDISMLSNKDSTLKTIDSILLDSEVEENTPLKTEIDNFRIKPLQNDNSNLIEIDSLNDEGFGNKKNNEKTRLMDSPCREELFKETSPLTKEHKIVEDVQETYSIKGKLLTSNHSLNFDNSVADIDILEKPMEQKDVSIPTDDPCKNELNNTITSEDNVGTMPIYVNEVILVSGASPKRGNDEGFGNEKNEEKTRLMDSPCREELFKETSPLTKEHKIVEDVQETYSVKGKLLTSKHSLNFDNSVADIDILEKPMEQKDVSILTDGHLCKNELNNTITSEDNVGTMPIDVNEVILVSGASPKSGNNLSPVDSNVKLKLVEKEIDLSVIKEGHTLSIIDEENETSRSKVNEESSFAHFSSQENEMISEENGNVSFKVNEVSSVETSLTQEHQSSSFMKDGILCIEIDSSSIIKENEEPKANLCSKHEGNDNVGNNEMLISKDDPLNIINDSNSCIEEVSFNLMKDSSCGIENDEMCNFSNNISAEICRTENKDECLAKINEGYSESEPLIPLIEKQSKIMKEFTSYKFDEDGEVSIGSVDTERVPSEKSFHDTFIESESLAQGSDEEMHSPSDKNLCSAKLRSVVRVVTPYRIPNTSGQKFDISKEVSSNLLDNSDDSDVDYIEEEEKEIDSLEENFTESSSDYSLTFNDLFDEVEEETETDADFIPEEEQEDESLSDNFTDSSTDDALSAKDFLDDEAQEGHETSDSDEVSNEDVPVMHIQSYCTDFLNQNEGNKVNVSQISENKTCKTDSKKIQLPSKFIELRGKISEACSSNVIHEEQRIRCFTGCGVKFKIRKLSREHMNYLLTKRPQYSAGLLFTVKNYKGSLKHSKHSIFNCNTHWKVEEDKTTESSSNTSDKAHCKYNYGELIPDKSKIKNICSKQKLGSIISDNITKGVTSLANRGIKTESHSVQKHLMMKDCKNTLTAKKKYEMMSIVNPGSSSSVLNKNFNAHAPVIKQLSSNNTGNDRNISFIPSKTEHSSLKKDSKNYVFIHNLSIGVNALTIKEILKSQKITEMTKIDLSKCSPRSFLEGRGYAQIEFNCPRDAEKCLKSFHQGFYYKGKTLIVTDTAQQPYSYD